MIRGLIFDFDGLILDTESTVYQSWRELYQEHGQELPLQEWGQIIGVSPDEHFDPLARLEAHVGPFGDRDAIAEQRLQRELSLVVKQPILPGVEAYLQAGENLGLKMAIASSSSLDWVGGHLRRLGLRPFFDAVHTSDDVERTKPDPALYQLALQSLDLPPEQAIVLEDSPNGVTAAQRAGIYCVAVPNPLTRQLCLDHADMQIDSLAALPLETLIRMVESSRNIGETDKT